LTAAAYYEPPACNPSSLTFLDVPASSLFCRWIEQAARDGITAGCGGGKYCPSLPVTREQLAMLLEKARGPIVLAYRSIDAGPGLTTTPTEIPALTVSFTLDLAQEVLIDFGGYLAVNADINAVDGNLATLSLELDQTAGLGTLQVGGSGAQINVNTARMIAAALTAGDHTIRVYGSKTNASFAAVSSRLFIRVVLP
jgi:hypothetical protein